MLLVDDDEAQREVVAEILALEGVEVLPARTAAEAAEHLGRRPDVVLLDLHGIAAEEFVDAARQQSPGPAIILLSGDVRLAEHARRLGAEGYLSKPYELEDLLEVVRQAISKGEEAGAAHPPA